MLYRYGHGAVTVRYCPGCSDAANTLHHTTPHQHMNLNHGVQPHLPTRQNLAGPGTNDAVATALDHVAVADADVVDDGGDLVFLGLGDSRAALPLPRLQLIVDLDHVLARRARDPSPVEHHARDPVVVRVRVEDRSRSQIPYLQISWLAKRKKVSKMIMEAEAACYLPLYCDPNSPSPDGHRRTADT